MWMWNRSTALLTCVASCLLLPAAFAQDLTGPLQRARDLSNEIEAMEDPTVPPDGSEQPKGEPPGSQPVPKADGGTPEGEGEPTPEPAGAAEPAELGPLLKEGGMGPPSMLGSTLPESTGSRPDVYVIVKGDTLWGISSRFWGDPYFWPKLWSYNPGIENAHFIYPGEELLFSLRNPVRAPGVTSEPMPPEGAPDSEELAEATGGGADFSCAAPMDIVDTKRRVETRLVTLLEEESIRPLGQLLRSPEEKEYLANGDTVYLKFSRLSEVSCGDIFTLYRPYHRLHEKTGLRKRLADTYDVVGEVRIVDINDEVATAHILRSYTEIQRGDLITDFIPVEVSVEIKHATRDIRGTIVDATHTAGAMGTETIVFLDIGLDDGVDEGDALYILRHGDGLLVPDRGRTQLPGHIIGKLVVMRSTPGASMAIVTNASESVSIGDEISMKVE